MKRIENTFKTLDRPALVTFITAGDPDYEKSLAVLKALPEAGADIVELGMPFSDPMADGPVIQEASQRALKAGANMEKTLQMVQDFRQDHQHTPLILMGYANPVYAYGIDKFSKDAAKAGVDGIIIVDLPPEEDGELRQAAETNNLSVIRLITPTTDQSRLEKILENASGFLYYVSITGITGTTSANISNIKPHIEEIKKHTNLPIAIGFGIKTPADATKMAEIGDAIVVGSAIVDNIAKHQKTPDLPKIIAEQAAMLLRPLEKTKA